MPSLRPSEQRVARLILAEPQHVVGQSIAELARQAETSTASVVRLCRALGYQKLRELRLAVLKDLARGNSLGEGMEVSGDIDRHDSLSDVVSKVGLAEAHSIADTAQTLSLDSLHKSVALLLYAKRVDVFGLGASALVANDLQQKLIRIGRVALHWSDSHSAWTAASTLGEGCVAVGISHSGESKDTVDFLRLARDSHAATVAITNTAKSSLTEYADQILLTAAREDSFRSGALGSRVAQLMVIDCLFIGVAKASYDESLDALNKTHTAVSQLAPRKPVNP